MCFPMWFSNKPKSKISSIQKRAISAILGVGKQLCQHQEAVEGSWRMGAILMPYSNTHRLLMSHHPKQNIAAFPHVAVRTSARQAVKEWMWAEEAPAPVPEGLSWYKNHLLRSLLFTHQTPWRESWHTLEQLFLVTVFPISPTTFNTQNLSLVSEAYVLGKKMWT